MKKAFCVALLGALAVGIYRFHGKIFTKPGGEVALIDEAANPIRLPSLEGQTYDLENYRGKVVVLEVWATWCEECVAFLDKVEQLHQNYKARDVVVLTLNLDGLSQGMSPSELREFVAERGLTVPVMLMDEGTQAAFASGNTIQVPQVRVYDRNLRVRYKSIGASATQVESVLNQLLEQ